ncbi:CoA-binding protein [Croceiramulus getboli]|nr:CoA-binding protein [Flavobacteriaceae bacterium YJPT1-3]
MRTKKTMVIGASLKPERYSNIAIKRLKQQEHEIIALGLRSGEVAGIPITTDRPQIDQLDTITLYLNPKRQEEYEAYILGLKPKRVIFNPGTENPAFARKLESAGIQTEQACTLVLLSTGQY